MAEPKDILKGLAADWAAGKVVPYLGPEVLTLETAEPVVPADPLELAKRLWTGVSVPQRIRNNMWHTAQYIETFRHRLTLDKLMADIFKPMPEPNRLHRWLASQTQLSMIVDTWYDSSLSSALSGRGDWGTIRGVSKARRTDDAPWTVASDAKGTLVPDAEAAKWQTLLYKPHGAAQPDGDQLTSDSDYVEVLTEIDIQTPIPDTVKDRRTGKTFLFLGCRLHDQILRTFARCIIRRSQGPHYVVLSREPTENETKFMEVEGIIPIFMTLDEAVDVLMGKV